VIARREENMNVQDPHFWFFAGLVVGVISQKTATHILRMAGYRSPNDRGHPQKIEVAFPRETLNGIAQTVAFTVVDAIHHHIEDLKVPSQN
jgi:hypothetical protein